ncbi:MAG: response regulator, partial [Leptospiraceae bacterium]|nr:response regulator [Leptospiraceae bacterium]
MKINPPPKLKIKVLYVEDDLVIRENIAALLNRRIESLEIASDGEEGFAKFKKFHPDLLITDIKMPKMDGITLSRNIFELDPDTNIIIMSAFSDTEYMLEAINLG